MNRATSTSRREEYFMQMMGQHPVIWKNTWLLWCTYLESISCDTPPIFHPYSRESGLFFLVSRSVDAAPRLRKWSDNYFRWSSKILGNSLKGRPILYRWIYSHHRDRCCECISSFRAYSCAATHIPKSLLRIEYSTVSPVLVKMKDIWPFRLTNRMYMLFRRSVIVAFPEKLWNSAISVCRLGGWPVPLSIQAFRFASSSHCCGNVYCSIR